MRNVFINMWAKKWVSIIFSFTSLWSIAQAFENELNVTAYVQPHFAAAAVSRLAGFVIPFLLSW